MTPEEQRIAIAKACGYLQAKYGPDLVLDYLNDLNAMNEAEKALNVPECSEYAGRLGYTQFDSAHATASERAEAFLKTKRLWKD